MQPRIADEIEFQRLALRAWMFDAEFVAKVKVAIYAHELLGDEVTPDIKRAIIFGAYAMEVSK